jgi:DNA-binding Xre family transcriptional regulator
MNTPVTFKTPNGEEMVVLSRLDYEALLEKAELAEDLMTIADYRKKLAIGEEEVIPDTFANRLIEGENPVRVFREFRGLTGRELAERTGISPAFLSEIETGKKDGGIATLKRIALELKVSLDDLIEAAD